MDRNLANFMSEKNIINKNNADKIDPKNVSVYNIRKTDKGLYFNVKLAGEDAPDIKDLFIPSKFYHEVANINNKTVNKKDKNKLLEYLIIYPGAIISLSFIILTIIKNLDKLTSLFGLYY